MTGPMWRWPNCATLEPPADDRGAQRLLLLARGMVLAQSGRDAEAQGWAGALRTHARSHRDGQAEAAAELVKALVRTMPAGWTWPPAWRAPRAMACSPIARRSASRRSTACAAPPWPNRRLARGGGALRSPHRLAGAADLLQHHAVDTGDWVGATQHARLARDLAAAAGDDPRLAWSTAELAWLSARSDSIDAGLPLLQQAQRLAQRSGDPLLLARARLAEARMAAQRDDLDGMRRLAEQALPLAQRAARRGWKPPC